MSGPEPSDAQLAWTLADFRRHVPRIVAERDEALAALRDARAENERERATVAHCQGVLIATCAEKAEVQRREAELRARIEALCDEAEGDAARYWQEGLEALADAMSRTAQGFRAALSPAEEGRNT